MKNILQGKKIKGSRHGSFFCLPVIILFAFISCNTTGTGTRITTPITPNPSSNIVPINGNNPVQQGGGSLVEEIIFLTERGTAQSLLEALDLMQSRNLTATDFGRIMTAVNVALLRRIYPSVRPQLPFSDPPITHTYSRILRDIEAGIFTEAPDSLDYLELVLPFLAYYPEQGRTISESRYASVIPQIERARQVNPESILAEYFLCIIYENTDRLETAMEEYTRLWESFPDFFPAALGITRVMDAMGRTLETIPFLTELVVQMPDNFQVKRQLAISYYKIRDWSRAESAVAEILQINNRDAELILMQAHIFVEQGRLIQAQAPLDIYASINPNNRLYLFLRARIQAEAFHNRDSALNYLRAIIRNPQYMEIADEVIIYTIRLFMDSPREEDREEGRRLINHFLSEPYTPLEIPSLALDDAIRRESWDEARVFLVQLLEERRSFNDLMAAYIIEKETGNNTAALSHARELYDRDRNNEEGIIAYITALIDTGNRTEASAMIESRLDLVPSGALKSRYFFLRSRIRTGEELRLNDLRSSLFEDPRNLDSLIAMYEIYFGRRDERRAGYYLRQALALAPNDQKLIQFRSEYIALFGTL